MGDRGFGQLSYDKGMLVLAATQADNVGWGTLALGDRSLLTYALTHQQTSGQSFDFRQWLREGEQGVPELYKRFVKAEKSTSGTRQTKSRHCLTLLREFSKTKRVEKELSLSTWIKQCTPTQPIND